MLIDSLFRSIWTLLGGGGDDQRVAEVKMVIFASESGLFVNLNQKVVACHKVYKVSIRTSHLIGPFQEYLQPLEELQLNMKNRMEVGAVLRELRLSNIQCKFEAEQMATEQNFQVLWRFEIIRFKLRNHLNNKFKNREQGDW